MDFRIQIIPLIIWVKEIMVGIFHFIRKFISINSNPISVVPKYPTYELSSIHAIFLEFLQENFVLKLPINL